MPCRLCGILYMCYQRSGSQGGSSFTLTRVGLTLRMNAIGSTDLSIYRGIDTSTPLQSHLRRSEISTSDRHPVLCEPEFDIPIGLPKLPPAGSPMHYAILKHWLQDCNESHDCILPSDSLSLPTRLMDVGSPPFSTTVRLYETQAGEKGIYVALSYPWGDPLVHKPFRTETRNLEAHKAGISILDLPQTMQDAISVTRELGLRYLWIDSLCIVQGPDGDWLQESERMEDVFRHAYVVVAATRAHGSSDGFLSHRSQRASIAVPRMGKPPLYVCEAIDDFQGDVLEGHLNRRGWVLQERVLARRTIYFAERQTYWQCGHGVRCETMVRMHK